MHHTQRYVASPIREHSSLPAAVEAAAERTRADHGGAVAGLIVELFAPPTFLPTALKQRMRNLITLTGNLLVDTALLSNLGRVQDALGLSAVGTANVELSPSGPGRPDAAELACGSKAK